MSDLKAVARRMYEEVITDGNLDVLDEIVHDDFIEHEEMPGMPSGKSAPAAFVTMFRTAFPDLVATIEEMVEEGVTLAVRSTFSGTHQGELMGLAPTGNRMEVAAFDKVRFRDGKVIEHWGNMDNLGMMQQLGAMPEGPPG